MKISPSPQLHLSVNVLAAVYRLTRDSDSLTTTRKLAFDKEG